MSTSLRGAVSRDTWLVADVHQVIPGLWSIPVPIPENPLGYTLVYLFESRKGPVLIDTGWDDDGSWQALVDGFEQIGGSVSECYGVLVTHAHPDHHGLSGRIREASGAWIALHDLDARMVPKMAGPPRDRVVADYRDELAAMLLDAGASADELAMPHPPSSKARRPRPMVAPDRSLADGERVDIPGWSVDAVWTPGHSPGHTCFRVPEHGLLLSGDHVLPGITPHIAISRSDRGGDPLGDFLESLRKVDQPDIRRVLPAHEHEFDHLHARVESITAHHHAHLAAIELLLSDGPLSLWTIASRLVWNRPWIDLTLAVKRSAVNETAAHLRYLQRRERATRLKGVRPLTFIAGPSA
jgi:glyoxylase-like metal-dependent hydrolase (beta-lactamase superfamily II)